MRLSDQEANRLRVLKAIRRAEPVARTELVGLTALSSGTVSEITGELLERGLLLESRAQASGRGRPRLQLMLNPDAAHVAGVFLNADATLAVEICNARGDRLRSHTTGVERAPTLEALAERIAGAVEQAIGERAPGQPPVSSVGLALPGAIDSIGGVVHWLQTYPIRPFPMAAVLEERLKLPVFVDNNTNVVARAEHWFGEDRQLDDFSLFTVGLGIGFGEYLDGRLKTGAHGINPEIWHTKVALGEGPTCICGAKGCLGTAATVFGAVLRIREARGEPPPRLRDIAGLAQDFLADAQAGEPVARRGFEQAGRYLGMAVANHINMTDPARILVLVENAAFADLIVAPFHAALQESIFPPLRGRSPTQFRISGEARYSHGAAAMVLERLYRGPLSPTAAPASAPLS